MHDNNFKNKIKTCMTGRDENDTMLDNRITYEHKYLRSIFSQDWTFKKDTQSRITLEKTIIKEIELITLDFENEDYHKN